MATGLIALLDDVAGIAKVAAASVDDVAAHAAKASAKSAGVVIDDTAVTPRYVVGFSADRELPIVGKIALGSLKNKLLILLPVAMLLSAFAPWGITPLLMFGGLYLCYEGVEKVFEALFPHEAHEHEEQLGYEFDDPRKLEDQKVAGAIRTDFILSAEIMAIALATVPDAGLISQLIALVIVAIGITAGVYGAVALIVKADDFGLLLAGSSLRLLRACGSGIVTIMPWLLSTLAALGTAAMIWVGGGIILHGLEAFGVTAPAHAVHVVAERAGAAVTSGAAALQWLIGAVGAGVFGLVCGAFTIPLVARIIAPLWHRIVSFGRGRS